MKNYTVLRRAIFGIAAILFVIAAVSGAYAAETLQAYAQRFAADPDDPQAAMLYAEAAFDAGDANLAAEVYERFLTGHSEYQTFRLRLIQIRQYLGDDEGAERAAREYAAAVRDRATPEYADDTPLRREVSARRQAQEGQAQGLRMNGRVSAGILYDSNANQGPSSDIMRLGNYNVVADGVSGRETAGAYLSGGLDFYLPSGSPGREWVGDLGFSLRGNFNSDLSDFDSRHTQWGRAAAGLRWADRQNLFDARVKAEVYDYQFNSRFFAYGLDLLYLRAVSDSFHLISRAGLEWRDYSGAGFRDGFYGNFGQFFRFFVGEPLDDGRRHQFTVGARYLYGGADECMFRYDGWTALASFSRQLPGRVELTPYVSFGQEFYKGPGTVLESDKRRDERLSVGVSAAWEFKESWLLEGGYRYSKNWSNSELYDYDQHVVTLGVTYGF